jgi:hypothetical protein
MEDLEYTPITEPLPAMARRGELDAMRADLDLLCGWLEIATNGVSARDLLQMADVAVEVRRRWGLDADGGQTRHE